MAWTTWKTKLEVAIEGDAEIIAYDVLSWDIWDRMVP